MPQYLSVVSGYVHLFSLTTGGGGGGGGLGETDLDWLLGKVVVFVASKNKLCVWWKPTHLTPKHSTSFSFVSIVAQWSSD